jgi:hypothetical protein
MEDYHMKKLLAKYLSWLMAFLSTPFLPSPSLAAAVATQIQNNCIDHNNWTPKIAKAYAKALLKWEYPHWNRSEWSALAKLWGKESGWKHTADNPKSTAYGIAQVLNTKPGTPAPLQIERGLVYIQHRYEKPSIAWAHWRAKGWY